MTITEKLSEALRELVSYEVDRIIDENNDWFMELLNKQIEACLKEAFVPVLRESDFAFDCEECGRFVEAGYDILIDDEIRVGSCCMRHDRNWTSAGSIIGPLLVRWWERKEETV